VGKGNIEGVTGGKGLGFKGSNKGVRVRAN